MYNIVFKPKAEKELRKLQRKDQQRVAREIDRIAANPFEGKKLEGDQAGRWSWRVWPYRIIYTIEKRIITVTVVAIGQRKDVYRRLR